MNNFSNVIPWIYPDDIWSIRGVRYEIFERMRDLGIKKVMFPLSVRYRFVYGIKWELLKNLKEIATLCLKYNMKPIFSFLPHYCENSYSTNIVIPKTTDAFYEFLLIADKFHPGDYYPPIGKFAQLFKKRRDDYLIGAWTYNHRYFPFECCPFYSKNLFGNKSRFISENTEYHSHAYKPFIEKYDFFVIKNDFNRPFSSFNTDREFYRLCSETDILLILTFDLFVYKYHGKPEIKSVKTLPELASQTTYGGEGFLEYTLRECPDRLYSQVENIDIGYIMDCLD